MILSAPREERATVTVTMIIVATTTITIEEGNIRDRFSSSDDG